MLTLTPEFKPYRAYYVHSNGDRDRVVVTGHDGKGSAWVIWEKDGFKNMMPLQRLERIIEVD